MIFDCFLFFNEFDVLEWRLHELENVVDTFVLLESTVTFQNAPKPLYFQEQQARYARFLPHIRHIVVEDTPAIAVHPMEREIFQRNQLVRGLTGAQPTDGVLISDVDEIPRATAVARAFAELREPVRFAQRLYHDFINLHCATVPEWNGTRLAPAALFSGEDLTPQMLRDAILPIVPDGGWHFSFLGGVPAMQAKLAAWSHVEWDRPPFNTPENLAAARSEGRDWDTDRQLQYEWTTVDTSYPAYLYEALAAGRYRQHVGAPAVQV